MGSRRGEARGLGSGGAMSVSELSPEAGWTSMGIACTPDVTKGTPGGNYKENQKEKKSKKTQKQKQNKTQS